VNLTQKRSAKGELVFTSFLFVVGVIVLWDASQLPESSMADVIKSSTFPSIIGSILVVLSVIQLISVARGNLGEPEEIEGGEADSKLHFKSLALVSAGLLFFALGIKIIGFPIAATTLFTLVVYAINPNKPKWYFVIPIAGAFALAIYFGFTLGLQINLPFGFDFNFNFGPTEVIVEENW
jgi:putative tricarboxylic transport membrane protein